MTERVPRVPRLRRRCLLMLSALCIVSTGFSQTLSGNAIATALRAGGYVIVMRHASSPRTLPAAGQANADNLRQERQLDDAGRSAARGMGEALRRLRIPIGALLSSPTYRALETVRLARFGEPTTFPELGDSGQSMVAETGGKRGDWLRARTAEMPRPGMNTLMVTHYPNMAEAFPASTQGLADGEALVFRPDGKGSASLVARVKIEEWAGLK